jgi:hypothetical protein
MIQAVKLLMVLITQFPMEMIEKIYLYFLLYRGKSISGPHELLSYLVHICL